MGSRHYVVPADDMTEAQTGDYRLKAQAAGIIRAWEESVVSWDPKEIVKTGGGAYPSLSSVVSFLAAGNFPAALDVRDFKPIQDAGCALDQWNTPILAAIGTEYSVFQAIPVPAIGLRIKQLVVWYGIEIDAIPLPISRLIFRRTAAAGSVMAEYDVEGLATKDNMYGFLSEPQIWNVSTPYAINVMARIVAGVSRVRLLNFVLEPTSTTSTS